MWGGTRIILWFRRMTLQDEHVVAFIAKLRTPGERKYAQRQWRERRGFCALMDRLRGSLSAYRV